MRQEALKVHKNFRKSSEKLKQISHIKIDIEALFFNFSHSEY